MLKKALLLFFPVLLLSTCWLSAQKSFEKRYQNFSVNKEKSVALAQKKIFVRAGKWVRDAPGVTLLRFNEDEYKIEAEGVMDYKNDVILENVFLSKDANLRTNGTIKFKILITCYEGKYTAEYTDFSHEAYYNRYGKISFETLLMNDKVPLQKCYENTEWCNAVWADMKDKARRHSAEIWIDLQKAID